MERVMMMSNSSLISYTKLSPNNSGKRKYVIDTITIHCMAGNCSIETCGNIFANSSASASSNYGIGSDGRIALYVDEANRSWCTSSSANDNRAVTIEVANTVAADPWPVSDAAYESLIKLVADICKRNNIKKLLWKADKSLIGQVDQQNMTVHRWFANKACPGDYLYNRHADIAKKVNAILEEDEEMTGEEIYKALMEYMATLPTSDYAKESSKKGIEAKVFSDGDGDGLVDNPQGILKRQELAVVLNRLGLLD
jgi:N-acetyl-anhydromuramyl-L-alanine amidase AmpD